MKHKYPRGPSIGLNINIAMLSEHSKPRAFPRTGSLKGKFFSDLGA